MTRVDTKSWLFIAAALVVFMAATGFAEMVDVNNPERAAGLVYGESPTGEQPSPVEAPYRYQYFPAQEVYYSPTRELFFYQYKGKWVSSSSLPNYLKGRLGDFVNLRMNIKDPYRLHAEVKAHYAPEPVAFIDKTPSPPVVVKPAETQIQQSSTVGPVYHYRYYPSAFVYFDSDRRLYFYQSGNQWLVSPRLPANIADNLGHYVLLQMNAESPYVYHSEVMKKFPHPGMEVNRSSYVIIKR